jgi:hypothetical protein
VIDAAKIFPALPATLRDELFQCYSEIVRNYAEHRWEPAELNGGKLCEVVYSIVKGALAGAYPPNASKPANMLAACQALEATPSSATRVGDRSLRILIPRLLPYLYEIRNNRGVGHVGGEVNPNHADSEAVVTMAAWLLAELIRVFHGVSISEAQATVEVLVERHHPLIWEIEGTKRVLKPDMSAADQTIVLLYSEKSWTDVAVLTKWVEYSGQSMFKTRVLKPLHVKRFIEFEESKNRVRISPLGIALVEKKLLKN